MIKGHTKIELTDVKTGEVKVVEKHNMVTNGLATMFKSVCGMGSIQTGIYASDTGFPGTNMPGVKTINIIKNLFGGLFLFEDQQEENVDNYVPTGDNELVGRGSTFAYSGEDTMLGSYNLAESGWQEDGSYKKVWDFNETQANGQISSISLTTEAAGVLGFGSKVDGYWDRITTDLSALSYYYGNQKILLNTEVDGAGIGCSTFCHADALKNRIMFFNGACLSGYSGNKHFTKTGIIEIYSFSIPFTKTGPFLDATYLNRWEKFEVQVPEEIISQCTTNSENCVSCFSEIEHIYLILKSSQWVNPGELLKIVKININTRVTEVIRITNNTSVTMTLARKGGSTTKFGAESLFYNGGATWINNGYVFFHAGYNSGNIKGDGKIYRINIQNQADISCVKYNGSDFVQIVGSDSQCFGAKTIIGDFAIVSRVYSTPTLTNDFVLNMKKNIICTLPGRGSFTGGYSDTLETRTVPLYGGNNNMLLCLYNYRDSSYRYATAISPTAYSHTLMTINNLSSPVVKTPDKTMRVTYIISEAPDEPTEPTV